MVHKDFADKLLSMKGISPSVVYGIFNINAMTKIKVVQVYAPTSSSSTDDIEMFYDDVERALRENPCSHTIIMGDLNAKLGHNTNLGMSERNVRTSLFRDIWARNKE